MKGEVNKTAGSHCVSISRFHSKTAVTKHPPNLTESIWCVPCVSIPRPAPRFCQSNTQTHTHKTISYNIFKSRNKYKQLMLTKDLQWHHKKLNQGEQHCGNDSFVWATAGFVKADWEQTQLCWERVRKDPGDVWILEWRNASAVHSERPDGFSQPSSSHA